MMQTGQEQKCQQTLQELYTTKYGILTHVDNTVLHQRRRPKHVFLLLKVSFGRQYHIHHL